MNHRTLCTAAFAVGLLAVGWVGAGYAGHSPLALVMTALIGVAYLTGGIELRRFHRDTMALEQGLASIPADLSHPAEWLGSLPAALRNPVRLRLEGERVGLPGPAVTPYLVGLLVLLGMLGTFLGMVVTLNGAVIALESTTDLQTIRAALAAPVKGLGFAFGTSVAGVAASAMLGLVSALCRRERLQVSQKLDTQIATTLRGFSLAHQRQETFKALQQQATALPEVVGALQAMMAQIERQGREFSERLTAEQERFYRDARGMYEALARSVDQSLKDSLTESARVAGATIEPVVVSTMAGIARETAALQERVAGAVQAQLDGVSARFEATVDTVSETWNAALARHESTGAELTRQMGTTLAGYAETFEQRSAGLLASVDAAHASLRAELAATTTGIAQESGALHTRLAQTVEAQLDGLAARFDTTVTSVAETWTRALDQHERASDALVTDTRQAMQGFTDTFGARSEALLAAVDARAAAKIATQADRDEARQTALAGALEAMASSLRQEWQQAAAQALAAQEAITLRLGETAREIALTSQAQAKATIDEVSRLMETASEAPRVAAEVIGELRRELSASVARDNELLAERSRIMETLGALLDAINHASTEQRSAIDALVASSTALLERAGAQFSANVATESARMDEVAGQITGSAIEVASLGEAFGAAVEHFSTSNAELMTALARIEGALDKSLARSDEQLAYYVAQAREIIDLSIMSQRQIVEDLQQIAGKPSALAAEA